MAELLDIHALSDTALAAHVESLSARDTSPNSNAAWREAEAEVVARGREAQRVVLLRQLRSASNEAQAGDPPAVRLRRDKALGQVTAEALEAQRKLKAEKRAPQPVQEQEVEAQKQSAFLRRLTIISTAMGLITGPISAAQAVQALAAPTHQTPITLAPHSVTVSGGGGGGGMGKWEALECALERVPDTQISHMLEISGHAVPPSADRDKLVGAVMSALRS